MALVSGRRDSHAEACAQYDSSCPIMLRSSMLISFAKHSSWEDQWDYRIIEKVDVID